MMKTITSPYAEEPAQSLTPPELGKETSSGGETILVVDDQVEVRNLVWRALQMQGYTVLQARDGEEALRLAAGHPDSIHLLLTDVIMPGMNVKVMAKQLTRMHPGLKILFMSGFTDGEITQRAVLDPGIAFLHKPFSLMELFHKVRAVLDTTPQADV
jgi:two-component system cell cycle sensor histidine kinase/response regulator CckA